MPRRCERSLHLGDYLPWQQMAVAQKNTSVTYSISELGHIWQYTDPWYFHVWVSYTPRFVQKSVVCTGVYWRIYSSYHAV